LPAFEILHRWIAASRTQPEGVKPRAGRLATALPMGAPRKQAEGSDQGAPVLRASQPNTLPQPCAAMASKDGRKASCIQRPLDQIPCFSIFNLIGNGEGVLEVPDDLARLRARSMPFPFNSLPLGFARAANALDRTDARAGRSQI
jgi:hypothetical protein